jgi:hypothetical protein
MSDELLDLPQNLLLHGIPLQQLGDKLLNCEIFYSLKEAYNRLAAHTGSLNLALCDPPL